MSVQAFPEDKCWGCLAAVQVRRERRKGSGLFDSDGRLRYACEFDEDAVRLKFIELTYGEALADDVKRWQEEHTIG